ncbi:MAG: hypothetical protein LUC41_01830 [Clostridiales bacterium]|nr:hypothetical protein [Clostridiales bacterium]
MLIQPDADNAADADKMEDELMLYSYARGADDSIYELESQGFTIEKDGENYKVTFPDDAMQTWENYIAPKLGPNEWNEYLRAEGAIFLFNLRDGVERFEAPYFKNQNVVQLIGRITGKKVTSLKVMLGENPFYAPYVRLADDDRMKKMLLISVCACFIVAIIFIISFFQDRMVYNLIVGFVFVVLGIVIFLLRRIFIKKRLSE